MRAVKMETDHSMGHLLGLYKCYSEVDYKSEVAECTAVGVAIMKEWRVEWWTEYMQGRLSVIADRDDLDDQA